MLETCAILEAIDSGSGRREWSCVGNEGAPLGELERDRRPGAATLSDVAREAGVGVSTASRVLRSHGSFSSRTRQSVLDAAARLGYVPNRIAGTLASTGSQWGGILIRSLANIVFPDLLRGASGGLGKAGFQSVISVTDYDPTAEEQLIESLLSWRPAGLLVAGLAHTERARSMLRGAGIRVVKMLDPDGKGVDLVVGFSNREAGRVSARHLLSRGYRRIGYAGHDLGRDRRAAKRRDGFREALAEGGQTLAAELIVARPSSVEAGRDGLERLMADHAALDAVSFSSDDMAIGGYFLCLSRGIAIPERMALLGYSGRDVALCAPQALSTIRTPRVAVGETSAQLVFSDGPPGVVTLDFDLVVGRTT